MLHLHELRFATASGLDWALVKLHNYPWVETCIVESDARSIQFSAPAEHIGLLLRQLTGSGELVDWQFTRTALAG